MVWEEETELLTGGKDSHCWSIGQDIDSSFRS